MVYYLNSTDCLPCKVNGWFRSINAIEDSIGHSITNCLIVSSDCIDEMKMQVKSSKEHLVSFDYNNVFISNNPLPNKDITNVLLLDKEHRIIALGNPINSQSVTNLYIKRIREIDSHNQDQY